MIFYDQRGTTAAEYGIALALVALVALSAFEVLGDAIDAQVRCAAAALGGSGAPCGAGGDGTGGGRGALSYAGPGVSSARAAALTTYASSNGATSGALAAAALDSTPPRGRGRGLAASAGASAALGEMESFELALSEALAVARSSAFAQLSGRSSRITVESLREALTNDDARVRFAARFLLTHDAVRYAMDVGSHGGAVDGEISTDDVEGFAASLASESLDGLLADTASGRGGNDGHYSADDLRALSESEDLPVELRDWANEQLAAGAGDDGCGMNPFCAVARVHRWMVRGLEVAVDAVWDESGWHDLWSDLVDGVFARTGRALRSGGFWNIGASMALDLFWAPFQIGGNAFERVRRLPIWVVQKVFLNRSMPGRRAPWELPWDGRYALRLYAMGAGDTDPISPSDVQQGSLGDCVTMAGLGAIAAVAPQVLRDAIHDNGDGTYTVRLYEQRPPGFVWEESWVTHYVTVDARVPVADGGLPIYARPHDGEIWPLILEKAWAQYRGGYDRINGDNGGGLLEALTGNTQTFTLASLSLGVDALPGDSPFMPSFEELARLHREHHAIIATTSNHAHFVLDVDEQAGTITVGNPWGSGYTEVLTYDELADRFTAVTSASTTPNPSASSWRVR